LIVAVAAVGEACGSPVVAHRRVAGGDVNDALRAELADGRAVFVKHRAGAPPGFYACEAAGLRWIAEGPLGVPAVVAVREEFLALEWVDSASRARDFDARLGRGLADLHALGADRFGAERLFIGPLRLDAEGEDWPGVYGSLLEQLARNAGLPQITPVIERLAQLCGPPEPPARLHGDLWSGNVMTGPDGTPWLVDPAAYGGHREVDLAMLRLFGSPGRDFLAAYTEVAPLADGHEERVALYQLLPLLVHSVLFGGHYGSAAVRAAEQYA
jgi:fructosamine-3-kinase